MHMAALCFMAMATAPWLAACSIGGDDDRQQQPLQPAAPADTTETAAPDTLALPDTPPGAAGEARITDTVKWATAPALTNLNFVYPSTDPYGQPVMLSGTISMGGDVVRDRQGSGMALYSHYTVCRANECPTEGKLDVPQLLQRLAPDGRLIVVSPDYYGFGATADKLQAYCIGTANAQATVDALIAARQLLSAQGYTWPEDHLFNIGYSQGAQTAMAVLRLTTERYPSLRFACTMAGGGPYDMAATYSRFIETGTAGMPSTVVNVLLAYNEYYRLGLPYSSLFVEPTLSHIDEWVLGKRLASSTIDRRIGTHDVSQIVASELLDLASPLSARLMAVLAKENLCEGWTPRSDEHILLVHHEDDATVPVENTLRLSQFMRQQGVRYVETDVADYMQWPGADEHASGAAAFAMRALSWLRSYY